MARTPYFFFIYRDAVHQYRWRFYAPNNRIIAESGEGYVNRADCEHAILLVKRHSPTATVEYHQSAAA